MHKSFDALTGQRFGTGQSIRGRTGGWWRLRQRILRRWIRGGLSGTQAGWALKTDLFDEASGPYHHMLDLDPCTHLLGMDTDLGIVRAAHSRLELEGCEARLVVCDVRALPFACSSLAVVLSLSTLDHFQELGSISASLSEIARALRLGGRLLLTLDNPRNPEVALRAKLPSGLVRRLRADDFPLGMTLDRRQAEVIFRQFELEILSTGSLIHAPRYVAIRFLDWLERKNAAGLARGLAGLLEALEVLSQWPVSAVTGHYVGWSLRKTGEPVLEGGSRARTRQEEAQAG